KGTPSSLATIGTSAGVDAQSVLPHRSGASTLVTGSFTPATQSTAFGFRVDGEWSEDSRNDQTKDTANGCVAPCGHHMRFFPAYDRAGNILPNSWIVGMDYAGINYDYQDNLYLVTNMRPETAASPTTPARLPGAAGTSLDFGAAVPGSVLDADGQGTGFASVQANRLGDQYQPARLDVTGGTLRVQAYGTSTLGSNTGKDNTLVNGLQLPFNASLEPFTVSGRIVGPLDAYTSTGRAAGVQFGPGQDDYVKLQIVSQSNVPRLQLMRETAAASSQVALAPTSALPTATGAVDVALVGDPRTSTVTGIYRLVNGGVPGAWQTLGTTTVTGAKAGRFFARQAQGGVYANAKGSTEFPAVFDSFAVAPDDVRAPDGAVVARYDIGNANPYTDTLGRIWSGDTGIFTPSSAPAEGATVTPLAIDNTADDPLFDTYRALTNEPNQNLRTFSYALPVPAGTGPVRLRMYFAERYSGNNGPGRRVYSITAEGRTVATDFDLWANAGGMNTAVSLTVPGLTVTDGTLNIAFKAFKDYGALNAVEVVREPG
ncbi:MAG: domain containing protein, partial [Frankiales bacterium]|nr:domain containing protein [Frankiales bacterium]